MTDIKLEGKTSQQLREDCMERYLRPLAKRIFAMSPDTQSVIFAVAQYWADNANDEVHSEVFPCDTSTPVWPSCISGGGRFDSYECLEAMEAIADAAKQDLAQRMGVRYFEIDVSSLVTAFASHCLEGCTQDNDVCNSYLPYAIARRSGKGRNVDIEIVGKILRPEWEDQFRRIFR